MRQNGSDRRHQSTPQPVDPGSRCLLPGRARMNSTTRLVARSTRACASSDGRGADRQASTALAATAGQLSGRHRLGAVDKGLDSVEEPVQTEDERVVGGGEGAVGDGLG
jgi:hypothetical protein